jgi:hypothetical protein
MPCEKLAVGPWFRRIVDVADGLERPESSAVIS